MKTDVRGCSTCPAGEEQFEWFSGPHGGRIVQFDYRTPGGDLFSCVAVSLDNAGRRRYVRYTDSETLHDCRREVAISLLAVMAGGCGHTGGATLAAIERKA